MASQHALTKPWIASRTMSDDQTFAVRSAVASPLTGQLARFAVVGVTNTALTWCVFALSTAAGLWYPAAAGIAFGAGAINGYTLNRVWTLPVSANLRRRAAHRRPSGTRRGAGRSVNRRRPRPRARQLERPEVAPHHRHRDVEDRHACDASLEGAGMRVAVHDQVRLV